MKSYDIFISYRRVGGADKARTIKAELELQGFHVFLDFDELKDGVFDQRIIHAIESAPIFMMILTPHALDRCMDEQDWVRREIEYAIAQQKHVVPVNADRSFDGFDAQLPTSIKEGLGLHQFSEVMFGQLFKESVAKMIRDRIRPVLEQNADRSTAVPSGVGALIHLETDVDCRIYRFGKEVTVALKGEDTVIRLTRGKHKLEFVSLQNEADRLSMLYAVPENDFEDLLTIELLAIQHKRERLEAEQAATEKRQHSQEVGGGSSVPLPPIPPSLPTPSLKKWLWISLVAVLVVLSVVVVRMATNPPELWPQPSMAARPIEEQPAIEYFDSIALAERAAFVQDSLKQAQRYQDSLEYVQAERAVFVKNSTEKANIAAQKAETDRLAKEKAEKEKAEQERLAEEKAAKEKAEKERLAAEKAERERLAAEQAVKEKAEKERREREAREAAEKAERERLAREAANKTYKVGDYYNVNGKEGVVFYVDETGKHGKIVSMTQSSKIFQWSSNESEQKRLIGASSKTNGAANMQAIQQRPNWRTDYPAFAWCARLGAGWYLPAIEELALFTLYDSVHDAVNRTLAAKGGTKVYNQEESGWYWSSTEEDYQNSDGGFCAWRVDIYDGTTFRILKRGSAYVRAVSAF